MTILDQLQTFDNPSTSLVALSLSLLSAQVEQAWTEIGKVPLPSSFKSSQNIVLVGMGGSSLAGNVIKDLEFHLLKKPFEVVKGYHLPSFVDENTLVVLSSYSGDTEETLSSALEATKKTKKIFIFSTGGKLTKFAQDNKISFYDPTPVFNPSNLPRFSLGYSLTTFLGLFTRLGLLRLNTRTVRKVVEAINQKEALYSPKNHGPGNLAKKLAISLNDRAPVLVGSAHLVGATQAGRNMFHETAKTFATCYDLPELNHHLLESLSFPRGVVQKISFLFFLSKNYHKEIRRRFKLTTEVLDKRNIPWQKVDFGDSFPLEEVYLTIQLCQYVSFYLAVLYGIDPGAIPWVDWFKKKLEKTR